MVNDFQFSCKDRLFLGEALFETLAIRHSRPCFAELHWQRLRAGIDWLGLSLTVREDDFHNAIHDFIQTHQLKNCGLKIILSFGEASRGLSAQGSHPQFFLQAFDLPPLKPRVHLIKHSWLRDEDNPVYRLKSISYIENVIARRQAEAQGADDGLFFNFKQHATETCTANLFIIKNNQIFTPPLSDGLLAGVTRRRVLQICREQDIEILECSLSSEQLIEADAIFLSSSLQGLQAVCRYEQYDFPDNNPVYLRLKTFLSSPCGD